MVSATRPGKDQQLTKIRAVVSETLWSTRPGRSGRSFALQGHTPARCDPAARVVGLNISLREVLRPLSNISRLKTNSTAAATAPSETSNNDSIRQKSRKPAKARGLAKVLFQNPEHHPFLAYLHTRNYELVPLATGEQFGNIPVVDIGVTIPDKLQFELDEVAYRGMWSMLAPAWQEPELWQTSDEDALQQFRAEEAAAVYELPAIDEEVETFKIARDSMVEIFDARRALVAAIQNHPNAGRQLSRAFVVRNICLIPATGTRNGVAPRASGRIPAPHTQGSGAVRRKRGA